MPKVRNFTKLQGVLGLSDTVGETGGFEAICGFHNHIERWCNNTPYNYHFGNSQQMMDHMQRINQREGSVIIFSRELPHGISPNITENKVRYAQYLRMGPESTLMLDQQEKKERAKCVRRVLPE